jgi:hypothetical protein
MAAGRLGACMRRCSGALNRGGSLARVTKGDELRPWYDARGREPRTDRWAVPRTSGRGTTRMPCRRVARQGLRASRGAGRPGEGAATWGGVRPREEGRWRRCRGGRRADARCRDAARLALYLKLFQLRDFEHDFLPKIVPKCTKR